jgi:hypothetical protein
MIEGMFKAQALHPCCGDDGISTFSPKTLGPCSVCASVEFHDLEDHAVRYMCSHCGYDEDHHQVTFVEAIKNYRELDLLVESKGGNGGNSSFDEDLQDLRLFVQDMGSLETKLIAKVVRHSPSRKVVVVTSDSVDGLLRKLRVQDCDETWATVVIEVTAPGGMRLATSTKASDVFSREMDRDEEMTTALQRLVIAGV